MALLHTVTTEASYAVPLCSVGKSLRLLYTSCCISVASSCLSRCNLTCAAINCVYERALGLRSHLRSARCTFWHVKRTTLLKARRGLVGLKHMAQNARAWVRVSYRSASSSFGE